MAGPIEVEEITLETSDELRETSLEMALNCRRTLDIASRHLDPALYDQGPFIEAVKQPPGPDQASNQRYWPCGVARASVD